MATKELININKTLSAASILPSEIALNNGIKLANEIKVNNTATCAINLLPLLIPLLQVAIKMPRVIGMKGLLFSRIPLKISGLILIKPHNPIAIRVIALIKLALCDVIIKIFCKITIIY